MGKREREIKKIRLYTYEIDKIVVYFRFLIFFFLLLFVFRIHIDRQIRFEEQQSGIIIGARGTISFHFWKKYLNNVCSDGTIFFIWRSKKAILEKKRREKKKGIESPGDTDGPCATAKLRNSFSIRSRPRREKRILCYIPSMKHSPIGIDRSLFRPLFLYFI